MISILGMTNGVAQEYEYVPFVREGVQWECLCCLGNQKYTHFTLELKDDAEINGKTYKAMHKYSGECIDSENDTVLVYLREEDRIVYGIIPDGRMYPGYGIGVDADEEMVQKMESGQEFVLYDFNDPVTLIDRWTISPIPIRKVIPDVVTIAGKKVNRYISYLHGAFCAIEGIGYDGLSSWYPLGYCPWINLSQVTENGGVIYQSEFYKIERPGEKLLSLVREDVQWVNERVIINKGDTTRYYYNYEFKGTTSIHGFPICYSYTDETLDTEKAAVAAYFQADYDKENYITTIFNDAAYYQTVEDGRNLIQYRNNLPEYTFARTSSDIEQTNPINRYITLQCEDFLNRQNFIEVEPVEIEGMECRRYAYVGEDGEPIAYVVEGIGFDSRDMGDLLTPFTRKPDPDADYQEYWGLSHVIKDGQIIYKGMRYRGDAPTELSGDVDGDANVTIADVTALIDLLLSGSGPRQLAACDLDGSGSVTIQDVTLLIDKLLSGN